MAATRYHDHTEIAERGVEEQLVLVPAMTTPGAASRPARLRAAAVRAGRMTYARGIKRAADLLIASLALLLAAPLLLLVAAMIRLDSPGPALFRQQRVGRGGQPFTIFKFRTMVDCRGSELQLLTSEDGTRRHKVRNDPRVTRIGKWLRRTSVDELPQLLNILAGHMSLIGPRPELVQIVATYEPWQHRRHRVRPGLTGWWQVSGRSDRPMHENTELDLYYVDNMSPGLDVRIVIRTIGVVLKGLGAF